MNTIKNAAGSHVKNNKWFYILIGILAVTIIYLFILNKMEAKKHAGELVETKQYFEMKADEAISESAKKQLSLMLKTFVWAVRSAMIRDNLDEVDQYFNELVKEENISEIVLASTSGEILVSTNKKREGTQFSEFYPAELLAKEDVYFTRQGSHYHICAPVLSLNTRLGTLFFLYEKQAVTWDLPANPAHGTGRTDTLTQSSTF